MEAFSEPYAPRSVRFLELWREGEWRLKVYGIARQGDAPSRELVALAKSVVASGLPEPARTSDRYGVGFLGIHEGRGANLVFLDWWARENELHHLVWVGDQVPPLDLRQVTDGGLHGCVWDLAVIAFERDAWVASALLNPSAPDLSGYLDARFRGAV
jgi:hypothetical protein